MTERESILERMSGAELEIFAAQGGSLPRHLVARMNQFKVDRMAYGSAWAMHAHRPSSRQPAAQEPQPIRRAS